MISVGVLALQGSYALHAKALSDCGVSWRYVRYPGELATLDGLIIPGGESTAMLKLMEMGVWQRAIDEWVLHGGGVLGTCAGMILMASQVDSGQPSLGVMDIAVKRNAYGRQLDSFMAQGDWIDAEMGGPLDMVFIRAPQIDSCGSDVEVLAKYNDCPVMVKQHQHIACAFHPEMGSCRRVHQYFIDGLKVSS